MPGKILTLENLLTFFNEQNKSFDFSVKESGKPIVVTVPANFEESTTEFPGMMKLHLKVCHTELNRNGSHVSEENMKKAMPSLKYRPILAYIHKLPNGEEDFYAHNIEIVEDENGEEKIIYTEKQVGCYTADEPYLEYDKKMDKTYVNAYAVIPEEYTTAANIIRRKGGTKVSCELVINELAYNAKEKYLDLIDFYFGGTTLLGCDENGKEIGEGMLGARADIADFCHEKPKFDCQDALINVLEKLNMTLENIEKGGQLTMDDLDNKVSEEEPVVEEVPIESEVHVDTEEPVEVEADDAAAEGEPVDEEPAVIENNACGKKKKNCSVDENNNVTVSFEISHEDIRGALFQLIGVYEEEDNEWYWVSNVYDDYFVFENWDGNKSYKQSYTVDGDNVALSGERQEVFKMLLTETEKIAIEKMRADYAELEEKYAELKSFKDNYDQTEIRAQKDAIFAREEYAIIADSDEFKALVDSADNYSVEECENKADVMFAKYCKSHGDFAVKQVDKKFIAVNFAENNTVYDPYGGLWTEYKKNNN